MKQTHRLRGQQEFKDLFRRGRRIEALFFHLMVRKNSISRLRLGCVASRAVDKRATVRNRLRRRAREWVMREARLRHSSCDVAIIFKKSASVASRAKLYEELERAFQKIKPTA